MNTSENIFSVSEINNLIKDLFDNFPFFRNLKVKGELSNWKGPNISGHIYFTLKDNNSVIKCVMFKYDAIHLKDFFKDGDNVIIEGSLSSYVPSGTYQIIVKNISFEGEGDILLKKKLLLEKLDKEGLFNSSSKKDLPEFPNQIGIIVGKNSAASKDIEFNISRRWPLVKIKFYYSLVQGDAASNDLISNLEVADQDNNDVLIIARGGGSIEDLTAFDDESLARKIFSLKTPIISAVGHEINKSICDLVADKYASTPTGACEISVPDKDDVLEDLSLKKSYLQTLFSHYINNLNSKIIEYKNNKNMSSLESIYNEKQLVLENFKKTIYLSFKNYVELEEKQLCSLKSLVSSVNPKNILKKGYVIIKNENNKIIKTSKDLTKENQSIIVFSDKEVNVKIIKE